MPPIFLLPGLCVRSRRPAPAPARAPAARRAFSRTAPKLARDKNRNRGVSALHRSGPRQALSVSKEPLPRPVLDPEKRTKFVTDPGHGLWGFFNADRTTLSTPEQDHAHGRAWAVDELRRKSWEELHCLYWVCVKERNRLATQAFERTRLKAGYGDHEAKTRDMAVRWSQRAIKHVLTERFYAWDEARKLARTDPTIDLSQEGDMYQAQDWEDEGDDEDGVKKPATKKGKSKLKPKPKLKPKQEREQEHGLEQKQERKQRTKKNKSKKPDKKQGLVEV
ncbi:MAG: 54S ribosomal protein L4 mitochondrial [Phylliscum demangeonii]|nr:MAG: 54S ribosomal protein L4 mitochondrial [Phylliscum demangeonii]